MDELDESGPIEEKVRTTIEKELRFLWLMWAGEVREAVISYLLLGVGM